MLSGTRSEKGGPAKKEGKPRQGAQGCESGPRKLAPQPSPPVTHRDCRLGSSHSASAGIPPSWLFCSIL